MQHMERLVGLFVEAHPRASLDRMLSYLVSDHGASGGLLAYADGPTAVVEVVRSLAADRLCSFATAWTEHNGSLTAPVVRPDYVIAPLMKGAAIIGALYLDRPTRYHDALDVYLLAAAKGLLAARAQGPETGPGVGVDQRALMQAVLERHEWNVSRVARELGVTRRTIYLRMERFGIKRKWVPKMGKPLV